MTVFLQKCESDDIHEGFLGMMTSLHENAFRITGRLWRESTDYRWIPLTKGQWCGAFMFPFLWWTNNSTNCWPKHSRGRWIEMSWRLSDIAVIAGIKHCLTSPTARLFIPKLTQANKKEKSMFCIIALRAGTPLVYVPQMANHYSDVIMGAMASQIINLTIVYSTVY